MLDVIYNTLRVRNRGGAPNTGWGRNFGGPLYNERQQRALLLYK